VYAVEVRDHSDRDFSRGRLRSARLCRGAFVVDAPSSPIARRTACVDIGRAHEVLKRYEHLNYIWTPSPDLRAQHAQSSDATS